MSDYDFRPGGSLKLKGGVTDGGVKKKKSSKSKPKTDKELKLKHKREERDSVQLDRDAADEGTSVSQAISPRPPDRKTDAERRFEEIQRQRRAEKVAKLASKTHKDRVQEFNEKLESLSEHHDIPKVGPG